MKWIKEYAPLFVIMGVMFGFWTKTNNDIKAMESRTTQMTQMLARLQQIHGITTAPIAGNIPPPEAVTEITPPMYALSAEREDEEEQKDASAEPPE